MRERITVLKKSLSANDLGRTGSHQVGVVIPKNLAMSSFFPTLPYEEVNPRRILTFADSDTGETISVNFIYYNNKRRGKSRDEFRMTGISAYCRSRGAEVGDILEMRLLDDGRRLIRVLDGRTSDEEVNTSADSIMLSGKWVTIGRVT